MDISSSRRESARAFYYSPVMTNEYERLWSRRIRFYFSSLEYFFEERKQKERVLKKAHSSLRKFCISISVYLWYFFSLDLSLFRFWDFLLLLLLLRLIRRSLERKRETKRETKRERIRFPKLFLSPGKKTFKVRDQKMKDFFCFYEREERLMRTQREREQSEREQESYFL